MITICQWKSNIWTFLKSLSFSNCRSSFTPISRWREYVNLVIETEFSKFNCKKSLRTFFSRKVLEIFIHWNKAINFFYGFRLANGWFQNGILDNGIYSIFNFLIQYHKRCRWNSLAFFVQLRTFKRSTCSKFKQIHQTDSSHKKIIWWRPNLHEILKLFLSSNWSVQWCE